MINFSKFASSEYNFFPSGSFDSRKDSDMFEISESKDLLKAAFLSSSEDALFLNSPKFIAYEECCLRSSENSGKTKMHTSNKLEDCLIQIEQNTKIIENKVKSKSEFIKSKSHDSGIQEDAFRSPHEFSKLLIELNKSNEENASLKRQVNSYKEIIQDYLQGVKYIKSILENFKLMNPGELQDIPSIDDSTAKSISSSLESVSIYFSDMVKAPSSREMKKRSECVQGNHLMLDNFKVRITPLDSPEPAKVGINNMKRQSSNMIRFDKNSNIIHNKGKDLKIVQKQRVNSNEKAKIKKQESFKSVSPILKSKYKTLIPKK